MSPGVDDAGRSVIGGVELELFRRGHGAPAIVLHGFEPIDPAAPFIACLAMRYDVLLPSHPGFGRSPRPQHFDSIYDLVRLYLDLIDALPAAKVPLIGFSFGGWLAAEIACICGDRLGKLILVDPVGIKISDRETPDILDIFNTSPVEVLRRSWHDPRHAPDFDAMSDEELMLHARNREALCLYAWHPYLHNPKLRHWLGRIVTPTLILWGESDGIVSQSYGKAFSSLIPGSRFELIEMAGHHPQIEKPGLCAERVLAFLDGSEEMPRAR